MTEPTTVPAPEAAPTEPETTEPTAPVVAQPDASDQDEDPQEPGVPPHIVEPPVSAQPVPDVAKLVEKNRAANREAASLRQAKKDLEKRIAVYEAAEQAKKRKELGELEAVKQELAAANARLTELTAESERMQREAVAIRDFRVDPQYARFMANEMANAGDVDMVEWFEAYRTKHPAFFVPEIVPAAATKPGNGATPPVPPTVPAQPKQPAKPTPGGGPAPVQSVPKEAKIAQLRQEYAELTKPPKMYEDGAGSRRIKIKKELTELGA